MGGDVSSIAASAKHDSEVLRSRWRTAKRESGKGRVSTQAIKITQAPLFSGSYLNNLSSGQPRGVEALHRVLELSPGHCDCLLEAAIHLSVVHGFVPGGVQTAHARAEARGVRVGGLQLRRVLRDAVVKCVKSEDEGGVSLLVECFEYGTVDGDACDATHDATAVVTVDEAGR